MVYLKKTIKKSEKGGINMFEWIDQRLQRSPPKNLSILLYPKIKGGITGILGFGFFIGGHTPNSSIGGSWGSGKAVGCDDSTGTYKLMFTRNLIVYTF